MCGEIQVSAHSEAEGEPTDYYEVTAVLVGYTYAPSAGHAGQQMMRGMRFGADMYVRELHTNRVQAPSEECDPPPKEP